MQMKNSVQAKIEDIEKRLEKVEKSNFKYQMIKLVVVLLVNFLLKFLLE